MALNLTLTGACFAGGLFCILGRTSGAREFPGRSRCAAEIWARSRKPVAPKTDPGHFEWSETVRLEK